MSDAMSDGLHIKRLAVTCTIAVLLTPAALLAQVVAEQQGETARRPVTGDAGVSSMVVMNRQAFRVLRDFFEPGAVRRMHSHEANYHVLAVITGTLRVTVEGEAPVEVTPGEVLELEGGITHSLENVGSEAATIVEVFDKIDAG